MHLLNGPANQVLQPEVAVTTSLLMLAAPNFLLCAIRRNCPLLVLLIPPLPVLACVPVILDSILLTALASLLIQIVTLALLGPV